MCLCLLWPDIKNQLLFNKNLGFAKRSLSVISASTPKQQRSNVLLIIVIISEKGKKKKQYVINCSCSVTFREIRPLIAQQKRNTANMRSHFVRLWRSVSHWKRDSWVLPIILAACASIQQIPSVSLNQLVSLSWEGFFKNFARVEGETRGLQPATDH